jgi:hypothetical protein
MADKLSAEVAKIKPPLSQIFVAQVNADRETEGYAFDFGNAFRRAGILILPGWTEAFG